MARKEPCTGVTLSDMPALSNIPRRCDACDTVPTMRKTLAVALALTGLVVFAAQAHASRFAGPIVVELAIEPGTPQTRDVIENHRRSREYVREIFGV